MAIRVGSTVINCADIELMTRFWSRALGLEPSSAQPDDDFRVLRGERVNLSLQVATTPVTGRDQMHLDLYSDDMDAQVERLRTIGATFVRRADDPQDTYVVLQDPYGNQFTLDFPSFRNDPIAGFDHDTFVWMDLIPYGDDPKDERKYRSHLGKLVTKTSAERGTSPYVSTGNLRRCPGASVPRLADGSAPFVDSGPLANPDCDPSEVVR